MRAALIFVGQQLQYVLEIHDGRWVYVLRVVNVWMPVNIE